MEIEKFKNVIEENIDLFSSFKYMTESMMMMISKLTKKEMVNVKQILNEYTSLYKDLVKDYDPEVVAHSFHKELDNHIKVMIDKAEKDNVVISCGNKCAGCCFQKVDINSEEAILLNKVIKEDKIEINKDILLNQIMCNTEEHTELKAKFRKCVFLDNDLSCKVYEFRPASCRTMLTVSDPELCDTEKYKDGQITRLNTVTPESILIAMHSASKETGGMSYMLSKYKKL